MMNICLNINYIVQRIGFSFLDIGCKSISFYDLLSRRTIEFML